MRATRGLSAARQAGDSFQRIINAFVDDVRRADARERDALIRDPIERSGTIEGLVAAVVSQLCRETGRPAPPWVQHIGSPIPFFAFPARSFELRPRLMIESPPPFRVRNVFVPESYLSRA
jgi:hypothetical protein